MQDYHVHTALSPDARDSMEKMCITAQEIGLQELAFTDHYEFYANGVTRPFFNLPYVERYFQELTLCREKFPNLELRAGMEFGQLHLAPKSSLDILAKFPFDYIIASIHKIDNVDISKFTFTSENVDKIIKAYCDNLLIVAQNADFDCLGHVDLFKRHCSKIDVADPEYLRAAISAVLQKVIERGKGIEINTSGLRKGGDMMPSHNVLELYYSLGGKIITIGSDAHCSEDLGQGLTAAIQMMKEVGFTQLAHYKNRNCFFTQI